MLTPPPDRIDNEIYEDTLKTFPELTENDHAKLVMLNEEGRKNPESGGGCLLSRAYFCLLLLRFVSPGLHHLLHPPCVSLPPPSVHPCRALAPPSPYSVRRTR
jgi:hypothetical protein